MAGQGDPAQPATPPPAAAAAAALFGALSRLRGARVFHPRGECFHGVLRVTRSVGVPLLEAGREHPAVVRLSRAAGLPEPLPDALGLSVRLPDVHGPGRHQDLLLATSGAGAVLQHLLLPGLRGTYGQPYSSLLPYRIGERLMMVGALPARPVFRLALAPLRGGWSPFAELHLGARLDPGESARLAFNPWNTGGGIRPAGPLMGLRRAAYAGSQRGRGLTEIP